MDRARRWLPALGLVVAGLVAVSAPAATATTTGHRRASARRPSPCLAGQLAVRERPVAPGHYVEGALGHSAVVIEFENRSPSACTLQGYPGVTGLGVAGRRVATARWTPVGYMGGLEGHDTTPPVVTLDHGGLGSAIVEGTDVTVKGAGPCPTLTGLLVFAPGTRKASRLAAAPSDCSGLAAHPVVAGATGIENPAIAPARPHGRCRSSELSVRLRRLPSGGRVAYGLGHSAVTVVFRNTSSATCTLRGYPGVAGLAPGGRQVTTAAWTPSGYMGGLALGNRIPPTVALAPGQRAAATVEGTDVPRGGRRRCPAVTALRVFAPGTHHAVTLTAAPADCSGLDAHPVVPGDTGRQAGR